jgi:hypothetical protein
MAPIKLSSAFNVWEYEGTSCPEPGTSNIGA